MNSDLMKERTKSFALRVIKLVEALPKSKTADVIGHQLLRSSTSVAANYRAACRARSTAEFISKLGIVEEETDESIFWLEMLIDAEIIGETKLQNLVAECNELLAIVVSSIKTARRGKINNKSAIRNRKSEME